jgi:hypothetical protein
MRQLKFALVGRMTGTAQIYGRGASRVHGAGAYIAVRLAGIIGSCRRGGGRQDGRAQQEGCRGTRPVCLSIDNLHARCTMKFELDLPWIEQIPAAELQRLVDNNARKSFVLA